jgi:uncharacterized protein YrrD
MDVKDERFEIKPGADVVGVDDSLGNVERVVVNPGDGRVIGLVVRKGLLLHRDFVIPIEAVEEASEDYVRVGLSVEEANRLPEYHHEDYVAPPAGWRSPAGRSSSDAMFHLGGTDSGRLHAARSGQTEVAVGGRPLRAGQTVICRDGEVGKLDLVLVDRVTRRATHFVVRQGGLLGRDTIVPVAWVRDINRARIYLDVSREQLEQLPEYRSDEEITDDVLNALWDRTDLPPAELQFVEVTTHDGIVELTGYTLTDRVAGLIEEMARSVRGVVGVRSRLRSFEDLAEEVINKQHANDGKSAVGSGGR